MKGKAKGREFKRDVDLAITYYILAIRALGHVETNMADIGVCLGIPLPEVEDAVLRIIRKKVGVRLKTMRTKCTDNCRYSQP